VRVTDNASLWSVGAADDQGGRTLTVAGDVVLARNDTAQLAADAFGLATRLEEVGGDLVLIDVATAPDGTFGFWHLAEVGGDLRLEGPSLAGNPFPVLAAVGGSVTLTGVVPDNGGRAFPALATVGGSLEVTDDPGLPWLELPALTSLGGDLLVRDAPILDRVDLPLLEEVPGTFEVTRCDAVIALDWAPALRQTGDLTIDTNPSLVDVTGLYGLEAVTADVHVTDNAMLGDDAALALVAAIESIGGTVVVTGNGP